MFSHREYILPSPGTVAIAVFCGWVASPEDTQSALRENLHNRIIGRSQKYFKYNALFRYLIGCMQRSRRGSDSEGIILQDSEGARSLKPLGPPH